MAPKSISSAPSAPAARQSMSSTGASWNRRILAARGPPFSERSSESASPERGAQGREDRTMAARRRPEAHREDRRAAVAMADARPFHWSSNLRKSTGEVFRIEGRPPPGGLRLDQRRQERRAQAYGRRHTDGRALPLHQRARDRGRAGSGRSPTGHRRDRRSSGTPTSTKLPAATPSAVRALEARPRCGPASSCSARC